MLPGAPAPRCVGIAWRHVSSAGSMEKCERRCASSRAQLRSRGRTHVAGVPGQRPLAQSVPSAAVREGENVLVWYAGMTDMTDPVGATAARAVLRRAAFAWPGATDAFEILTLAPT